MIKKLVYVFLAVIPLVCHADEPATSCPAGYQEITTPTTVIANTACPTEYTATGDTTSCLYPTPDAVCMMFAPTDISFSDISGQYKFDEICPME